MSTIPTASVADNLATVEGVSTTVYRSLVVAHIGDYKTAMKMGAHSNALRALAEASHLGRQWKKSATERCHVAAATEAEKLIDWATDRMNELCVAVLAAE
ncbi:hypothetical protein M3C36_17940 [Dietzia cinnamea]|uniref:hypothetical protein n=1 Tax=Dietzia TaxID=37914 RepID=UPI000D095A9D|nr:MULTISPECIES: hypothetical protein [Dietzia]AVM66159.1 hypothetical protein C3V38_16515 [Dietzia sp. oral taxon 368]MCT1887030.1 hypothetical protein [Dietzia cinnamea]